MSDSARRTGPKETPLDAISATIALRDQRDLMQHPFFSLAKAKRVAPILYTAGDVEVQVHALPDYGMATIWDADILIWAASQLVEAADRGRPTSRFIRFTPHQLLIAIGRAAGQRQYQLLRRALQRLQSTVILTTIRNGTNWRRQQFSWLNEWEDRLNGRGRSEGMEFVLPEWFFRGVVDRSLVLTIDPAYFKLTGGIERWLYRVARKHAGKQPDGWRFELKHLHLKSGSQARFSDFALDVRRIVQRQSLPGYRLTITRARRSTLLHIRPIDTKSPARLPVDNSVDQPQLPFGTSGAIRFGTSGAPNIESNEESNIVGGRRGFRRRGDPNGWRS
ncbi:replication initiator protein A [Sphingopyxis indica]|uniref:Plasmid replication initiator protein n=1 Tax=Sphingopyxis indica TaxID=436663 RepID=A0A239L2Y3_9SPHN|nr:replication initiator protein A [Sphingopyxis indica]SNT24059.1 Plasmid replication initiator protein [Sphingopyxis indica]